MPEFAPLAPFEVSTGQRLFLGMDPADGHRPLWAGPRESVGIIGPPGYGKTSGLIVPMGLTWDGPAIITSTRGDVLAATGDHRRRLAERHDGTVHVYDPFGSEPGVRSLRWSPLDGCRNASVVYRRVGEMVEAGGAVGVEGADHFKTGAKRILRGLFLAAACTDRPLETVLDWLAAGSFDEPVAVLRGLRSGPPAAARWAAALDGMRYKGERERGSFVSVAENVLDAAADDKVLVSTRDTAFDVDHFLDSRSTLYVLGPIHFQAALRPMIVGLVSAITERAFERAAAMPGGVLVPRLGLIGDEIANIAPLPSLPGLLSAGAGSGVVTVWAAQSLDHIRARYGTDTAAAILAASTVKITYGGITNDADLRMISTWAGERRVVTVGTSTGGVDVGNELTPRPGGGAIDRLGTAGRSHTTGHEWRPILPIDELRGTREGHAWLWHRSDRHLLVETRPAGLVSPFAALAGYTPSPGGGRP